MGWDTDLAFADAGGVIHTRDIGDCAKFSLRMFSATAGEQPITLHESGHQPFGLADEYCCDGGYFEQPTLPNVYKSLANCETDAPNVNRSNRLCRRVAKGAKVVDWWTSDPAFNDLMLDNKTPNELDIRRIEWLFSKCDARFC